MREQLLLFLPVIHAGYKDFLDRNSRANEILLIAEAFADDFPVIRKEIRALTSSSAAAYLQSTYRNLKVKIVTPDTIQLEVDCDLLIAPDEELIHEIVDRYSLQVGREVRFERTFLRWDRTWSLPQPIEGEFKSRHLTEDELGLVALAREKASASSDWWRQVGAAARLQDGTILTAHNRHYPTEYSPYVDGDPRNVYRRGERADLSTAMHAEASIVAQCAREGRSLLDAVLYVTTFPCPSCARLIGATGISDCYFETAYSVLAGEELMRGMGVRLHLISGTDEVLAT